jgi:hypothetical protein
LKTSDGGTRLYSWVSPSLHRSLMHSWRRKEILKGLINDLDKNSLPSAEILFDNGNQSGSEGVCRQASSMCLSSRCSGDSLGLVINTLQEAADQHEEAPIVRNHGPNFEWLHV